MIQSVIAENCFRAQTNGNKNHCKTFFWHIAFRLAACNQPAAAPCPIALRLMTWTNNFSKTFLIFASLIPFFRLIIPEKCFYQWILCHNFVYMKKFPWFLSFELGARQACDRRHRTMGTVHSGKISHLTWTFTKKYWAVLGCTGLYWAVLGHLRYLLGNVQVKWRILPLCNVGELLKIEILFGSEVLKW